MLISWIFSITLGFIDRVLLFHLGQDNYSLGTPGQHLQRKVHAPDKRSTDHILLRRWHHLLHTHRKESGNQQTVPVHLPLWHCL